MKAELNESTRIQVAIFKPRINIIQQVVCNYYELPLKLSEARTRKKESIKARQRIHFLCREYVPHCPLSIVGLLTGNGKAWDHSSVCHSASEVYKILNFRTRGGELVYPKATEEVNELRGLIKTAFKDSVDIPVKNKNMIRERTNCPVCGKFMRVK
jgi:hypothetical protein